MVRVEKYVVAVLVVAACGGSGEITPTAATTSTTVVVSTTATTATTAPTSTAPTSPPPTTTVAPTTAPPTTVPGTTTASTEEPGPFAIVVDVRNGVVTGESHVVVERDTEIELTVTADVADEVHVHFFDHKADVAPGAAAVIVFVADVAGIFEVELEKARLVLLELEVR